MSFWRFLGGLWLFEKIFGHHKQNNSGLSGNNIINDFDCDHYDDYVDRYHSHDSFGSFGSHDTYDDYDIDQSSGYDDYDFDDDDF